MQRKLLQVILEAEWLDNAPRLAYADWLEKQGELLAGLIRTQVARRERHHPRGAGSPVPARG
jgi:uncharacterized protein (TIGR02996 family)